jgi:glycosyltransferase involved in cell wall biosynthesis
MITVDLDSQTFLFQRRGGISNYFVHLAQEFSDPCLGVKLRLPFWISNNDHLREARIKNFWQPPGAGRHHLAALLANTLLPRSGTSGELLHATHYHPLGLKNIRGRRLVVTIYDMIPELFPEIFPKGSPHYAKADYVRRADAVICISKSTRDDLISLWDIDPSRTFVIHLGASVNNCALVHGASKKIADEYLLFVGDRGLYKNFAALVEAFSMLRRQHPSVHLLCVGGGQITPPEACRFQELGIAHSVHWTEASDTQLRQLYRNARAFVFPSLYEGFGLPLLEAMADHCPIVASRGSSFPEVCDEAAEYFDPRNAEEIAAAIDRVLSDPSRRRELMRLGDLRCRTFTWRRTAEKTADVYRALVLK